MDHRSHDGRSLARAVEAALAVVLGERAGSQSRLERAAAADQISAAAERLSRAEVMAARDTEGASWQDVGDAFGITRQSAHERFRTGPDGLHTRWFKRHGLPG